MQGLLDRFRRQAPEEVRALAREVGQAATEACRSFWKPKEALASPGCKAAIVGGVALFAAGWLIGRKVRMSPRGAAWTAAAVAGAVAAGMLIGARMRGAAPRGSGGAPAP